MLLFPNNRQNMPMNYCCYIMYFFFFCLLCFSLRDSSITVVIEWWIQVELVVFNLFLEFLCLNEMYHCLFITQTPLQVKWVNRQRLSSSHYTALYIFFFTQHNTNAFLFFIFDADVRMRRIDRRRVHLTGKNNNNCMDKKTDSKPVWYQAQRRTASFVLFISQHILCCVVTRTLLSCD